MSFRWEDIFSCLHFFPVSIVRLVVNTTQFCEKTHGPLLKAMVNPVAFLAHSFIFYSHILRFPICLVLRTLFPDTFAGSLLPL